MSHCKLMDEGLEALRAPEPMMPEALWREYLRLLSTNQLEAAEELAKGWEEQSK